MATQIKRLRTTKAAVKSTGEPEVATPAYWIEHKGARVDGPFPTYGEAARARREYPSDGYEITGGAS